MIPVNVRDVSVSYNGARVVEDLSLEVPDGRWIGLIGPNGAGKTTLLRAIAGLVDFEGEIELGNEPVARLNRRALARLVAYVPQFPFIPRATSVTDYVLLGRTPYIAYFGVEGQADVDVVEDVLDRLKLGPLADRLLGSLSGGELQRAILARALAQQAPVLLLDEPTAALDVGHQQQVLELVDVLRRDHELTVISSMHDLTLASQFSESVVLLDGGRMVANGSAASVLTEEAIREHFGAAVRVMPGGDGSIVIVPRRPEASAGIDQG